MVYIIKCNNGMDTYLEIIGEAMKKRNLSGYKRKTGEVSVGIPSDRCDCFQNRAWHL